MQKFFKGTEKKPFTYPTIIEVRKGSKGYIIWIVGIVLLIIIAIIIIPR